MNVAIIGLGNIGSGLAYALSKTQHSLIVADRNGGQDAVKKVQDNGINARGADIASAVKDADIIILSTPYDAAADIAQHANFDGKIVIDVSNPVTADFSALQVGHTTSAAEEIAKLIPSASVVKAFNTIFAAHYANDLKIGGEPLQTFVAADNEDAKQAVLNLASDIGLDARNAGPLANARYLEGVGYMNIQFGFMLGQGTNIAPRWVAA